ncbi:glycosyltransferase family 4 protein [Demequina lignilytica]|uniref:Glycosyltransferase family 4 protein n=1 Tax=Demequina lignilytica TaxID=3051663 RepID=A0AB35MK89_9MICO|nr:glycosyltransferase family 4 protein [Demequina sp. SYSU T0a273]MDN4484183.1 glycosyltransferase family 4 protein [Demequina sp. SYSU T0a273]
MRLVVVSQLPPPFHGSTIMTARFLEALRASGHEVLLVERRFSRRVDEVGRFSVAKIPKAMSLVLRAWRYGAQRGVHGIIVFSTTRTFSFLVDWVILEALRPVASKTLLYVHTVGYEALAQRGRLWRWLVSRTLGQGRRVVCLGPSLVADVRAWVPPSRVTIIGNTTTAEPGYDSGVGARRPSGYFLFFSNLIPEKGPESFLDASIAVAQHFGDAKFVLAGASASDSYTAEIVRRAQTHPRIEFVGAVTDPREKWELIRGAAALVFPSSYPYEAQPLTILEAMSVGTPVVAFDVGGISDVVVPGVSGLLVPPGDTDGLVVAMKRLLGEAGLRESLSAGSRERFSACFSESTYRENWEETLGDLVDGAGP